MTAFDVRVERVFQGALELEEDERGHFVERECREDPELRRRVEALLAADAEAPAKFLVTDTAELEDSFAARALRRIGEFEIVERLGEGGMGTVYAAVQRSPRREVALKVIRPGRMTPDTAARFQREIEVLGNLRHPGIAQIHQAGSASLEEVDGTLREFPFFVMERVHGLTLLDHVRRRGLDLRARLELFGLVCDAVHQAHLQGVVHRDLKSENVLVSDEESGSRPPGSGSVLLGQPKILDFGIARLLDEGESQSRSTRAGDLIGTLTSASPEQLRGDAVDVRTDVYSLGVLLYQLLADRLPIALAGLGLADALRAVEGETPPPLGTLRPELRGDLTVIAQKALEKDPERRYSSAAELADDVRRHLAGEPIRARAHSRLYVLRRTLARHRGVAATLTLVFLLLLAFLATYRRQAIDNRELAEREAEQRRNAEEALAASRIERGRLLGRTGNAAGERLIWQEYLQDPGSAAAHWALREFYAAHPVSASRNLHEGKVRAAVFHPEDGRLATVADDGRLRLLRPGTLSDLRPPIELDPSMLVLCLAFRPGTDELVGGTLAGQLLVWDTRSGELLRRFGDGEAVRCLGFDRAGTLLAAGYDNGARIWDPAGRELRHVAGAQRIIYQLSFDPTGSRLAIAASRGLWLVEPPLEGVPRKLEGHVRTVNGALFSEDGTRLYSTGADGLVLAWELLTDAPPRLLSESGRPRGLRWDPVGGRLVVMQADRMDLVDPQRGAVERSLPLTDFAWGLDCFGGTIAVGDLQGRVRMWRPGDAGRVQVGAFETPAVAGLSADGETLVAADGAGNLVRYDGASQRVEERSVPGTVTWIRLGADGEWIWSAGDELVRWAPDAPAPERFVEGVLPRRAPVFDLSADGRLVAVAGSERAFRVHTAVDGEELHSFPTEGDRTFAVAWSPVADELVTVARNEESVVHRNLVTGEVRVLGVPGQRPLSVAFSPDGAWLVVGTWERVLQVWDLASGRLTAELEGHEGSIWDVAFLSDTPRPRLVSYGADGTLRVWSIEEERELATFPVVPSTVPGFFTGERSDALVLAGGDGSLVRFDFSALERFVAGNLEFARENFAPEKH